jgi:membrane-bound metal-dependent hydrolase YbcI (DUF457 family)
MFVGHYGPAFAANAIPPHHAKTARLEDPSEKRLPLWLLFVAVQFVDVLWGIFVLLGIEKVRIVPGITAASPLDLYYMPYTHSLLGALGWSLFAATVCQLFPRWRGVRTGLILGAAVFSHWLLDLLVHRPDLALYPSAHKMGFGLWNYRVLSFILEMAVLFGGGWMYIRTVPRRGKVWAFLITLAVLQFVGTFVFPPPPSDRSEAMMALFFYALLAAIAAWVERGQATMGRALGQIAAR